MARGTLRPELLLQHAGHLVLVEGTLAAQIFSGYTNTPIVHAKPFGFHLVELVESLRTAWEVPRSIPVRDKQPPPLPTSKSYYPW